MSADSESNASQHPLDSQVSKSVQHFTADSGNVNPLRESGELCENFAKSQPQISSTLSSVASILHGKEGSKLSQETIADGEFVDRSAQVSSSLACTATPQLLYRVRADLTSHSGTSTADSQRSCRSGSRSILGNKILHEDPLKDVDTRSVVNRTRRQSIATVNREQIDVTNYVVPRWVKQQEDVSTKQAGLSSSRLSKNSEFRKVVDADPSLSATPDLKVNSIIDRQAVNQEVGKELDDVFGIFPDSPNERDRESDSVVKFHTNVSNRSCETNVEIDSRCESQTSSYANKDAKFILIHQEQLGCTELVDDYTYADYRVGGERAAVDDRREVLPNLSQFERVGTQNCSVVVKRLSISEWQKDDDKRHAKGSGSTRTKTCKTAFPCGENCVQKSPLKKHKKVCTRKKPHSCLHCGKNFRSTSHLKIHERHHTGEKPYVCSQCGKKFVCLSYYKIHERIHTGEKPYACSHCGKKYVSLSRQRAHEKIHTGEKPFACTHCGKTFVSLSRQKSHEQIHTGDKSFVCLHCGKTFTSMSNCKAHERTHTDEKPYACSHCGRKFVNFSQQKIHERTHTGEKPYPCSHCDKKFVSTFQRKVHERTHTGEKPYACSHCDKKFVSFSQRQVHERTHTGEKPYACLQCGRRFKSKSFITAHRKVHNGDVHFVLVKPL